jgi:hypothetical protein
MRHEVFPDRSGSPIQRVIDEFWRPDMLGVGSARHGRVSELGLLALRSERRVRTNILRRMGFLGLRELEESSERAPLDVRGEYEKQDRLLTVAGLNPRPRFTTS